MDSALISRFAAIVGDANVVTDPKVLAPHGSPNVEAKASDPARPQVVVLDPDDEDAVYKDILVYIRETPFTILERSLDRDDSERVARPEVLRRACEP